MISSSTGVTASAEVIRNVDNVLSITPKNWYDVECHDAEGNLKWKDRIYNAVTGVGVTDLLDKYLKGSAYTAAWYVGLVDGGSAPTFAVGDTMASHAGWTENHASYSNATRPALTLGTVTLASSTSSVDNSASKATFTITGTATIAGMFVVSNSTKNGTTGTLYGTGAFSGGNKSVANGDTLSVTVTLTATAS